MSNQESLVRQDKAVLLAVRFFDAQPQAPWQTVTAFAEPRACWAACRELPIELLDDSPADSQFTVLFISADDNSLRGLGDSWVGGNGRGPATRASFDGGWVKWAGRGAVVQCPPGQRDQLLAAVAELALYEGELTGLEAEIAAAWGDAQKMSPLAQRVGRAELDRSAEAERLTAATVDRRFRCARIERRLLSPANSLGPLGRQLGQRLRDELDVEDRLDTLDGQIEVFEDLCEAANQRISDYRHFRKEFIVEIIIVLLLLAEVGLFVYEYVWPFGGD